MHRTLASVAIRAITAIAALFLASPGRMVGNPAVVSRLGDPIERSSRVPDTLRVVHLPVLHAHPLLERTRSGPPVRLGATALGLLAILGPVGILGAARAAGRGPRQWWAGRAWRAPPPARLG